MRAAKVVRVAVADTAYHFDKLYDYLVPPGLEGVKPGCRVLLPFGKGNRKRHGVVVRFAGTPLVDKLKPILSVLDKTPPLSDEMLRLGIWMKEHIFCTYFEGYKAMLPAGINVRMVRSYQIAPGVTEEQVDKLQGPMKEIAMYLLKSGALVERDRLLKVTGLKPDSDLPARLVKMNYLIRTDDAVRRMSDAVLKMAALVLTEDELAPIYDKLTKKQQSVATLLLEVGGISVKEICYFTGTTPAVVNALHKKGIVKYFDTPVYRAPYDPSAAAEQAPITLTEEQSAAVRGLDSLYEGDKPEVALLYGITGSGKTQVYLRLIDRCVGDGRGVIVMVPEISLTPQTLKIFYGRYGRQVAVFHSAMSLGQRMDEWKRVKEGGALIAVGTRSAVFAPFKDIGLIIMDEEQEHTYKSEATPRYNARDIARFRTAYHKSLLVLSSATPLIESYSAAKTGRYHLFTLKERYGDAALPKVVTVDMRQEIGRGNTGVLSGLLTEKLILNLKEKRQSILLLNRRGHNTYISCPGCGYVFDCPHCSISLTYHSANRRMMCHYCGFSLPFQEECPACGRRDIRYAGSGTQKIEQELAEMLPAARTVRMDTDSTMSRYSYDEKLQDFAAGKYDIMLGTQMVAKGLDFENVTLVGVLNADQSMWGEDFRSYERTFSLLTQVVGRSGRGKNPGMAVIQTTAPENGVIGLAARQDYEAFYEQEMLTRKTMVYPPYCDLCLVGFSGEDSEQLTAASGGFLALLKDKTERVYSDQKLIVLGPAPGMVPKVAGRYRQKLIIKCRNNARFREMMSSLLTAFQKESRYKNCSAYIDINPSIIF